LQLIVTVDLMTLNQGWSGAQRNLLGAAALFATFGASNPAISAQQDEIQVYTDDINKRGEFGLEWHLNTTPQGRTTPDYPGEITNNHGFRFTPEFSYGLTSDVELGLYLPMLIDGSGDYHFGRSSNRTAPQRAELTNRPETYREAGMAFRWSSAAKICGTHQLAKSLKTLVSPAGIEPPTT
jgi:hypothetical protein